jgi:hypothetical protein
VTRRVDSSRSAVSIDAVAGRRASDSQAKHIKSFITREDGWLKSRLFCCFGDGKMVVAKSVHVHLDPAERDANL